MTRLIVTGGRDFTDRAVLFAALDHIQPSVVIHGGARGADQLADEWAKVHGVPVEVYHADWEREGKRAGYERNTRMARDAQADGVLACPGGRGTEHMVNAAKRRGIVVSHVRDYVRQLL